MRAERNAEVTLFAYFAASVAATLAIGPASAAGHAWARIYQGMAISVSSILFVSFFLVFARVNMNTLIRANMTARWAT